MWDSTPIGVQSNRKSCGRSRRNRGALELELVGGLRLRQVSPRTVKRISQCIVHHSHDSVESFLARRSPLLATSFQRVKLLTILFGFLAGLAASLPADAQVRTATTHPMKYLVSLPAHWSADRTWPVLIAPSAHHDPGGRNLAPFAAERDARKSDLIIVAPLILNADPMAKMTIYRGAVADAISACDAAPDADGRDETARAKFDSEGVCAVIRDVQKSFRGEETVWIAGFSASTHVAYLFLFTHPELLKGVVINSGGYLGRGVDDYHIPLRDSPERAGIAVKFIIGESDPGYDFCMQNWEATKAQLLSYGHPAANLQMEIIRKGNADKLGTGHQWFLTRILDCCSTSGQGGAR